MGRIRAASIRIAVMLVLATVTAGCDIGVRHEVLAVTETNIGVDISQDPATQTPHARLGYQRVEVAIVPTGRSGGIEPGGNHEGAATLANVLMELRYFGIFSSGPESGIYQRLAVGREAVSQPGAWTMLARNASGNIDPGTQAAMASLRAAAPPPDITLGKAEVADLYLKGSPSRDRIDKAIQDLGYKSYRDFMEGNPSQPTPQQIDQVKNAARQGG